MTATNATLGYGSQIYSQPLAGTGTGSGGGAWTQFAATIDLKGPEPEVGKVKITNNDSPNNTHEYKGGMLEPGSQDFEVVYNKTEAARIYAMLGDGNNYNFAEVFPDGAGWTYTGFIDKMGTETKTEDEAIHNTISIKLTSKPAFNATLGATVPGG